MGHQFEQTPLSEVIADLSFNSLFNSPSCKEAEDRYYAALHKAEDGVRLHSMTFAGEAASALQKLRPGIQTMLIVDSVYAGLIVCSLSHLKPLRPLFKYPRALPGIDEAARSYLQEHYLELLLAQMHALSVPVDDDQFTTNVRLFSDWYETRACNTYSK